MTNSELAIDTVSTFGHNGVEFQYGRRQVGKSTTIMELYPDYTYITLDDENYAEMAKSDGSLFFRDIRYPLIIDEAQYAPELFRVIKRIADSDKTKGKFFLTGSQSYELMSSASESLAGRISIVEMRGLSLREMFDIDFMGMVLQGLCADLS